MKRSIALLSALADGQFHSGEELGAKLGVSRGAVWKQLKALERAGLELFAVRGRGYRLPAPLELLDRERILAMVGGQARGLLRELTVHAQLDSTNRELMRRTRPAMQSGQACLAEAQTDGRGRAGRRWVSPLGANLYLSLAWRFPTGPAPLAGLSLVAGVALARALAEVGAPGVGLKWPNDLVWAGRKLGGLLLELSGEAGGPSHVIVGVGVNVRMPAGGAAQIDQPWADLSSLTRRADFSRNRLAALILQQLIQAMVEYEATGAASFMAEWRARDVVCGRPIRLHMGDRVIAGTAVDVDDQGALWVEHGGTRERFTSGEVSLRVAE